MKKLFFVLRIVSAVILLQTLFFKFTAAPESQFIFNALGVEPWGRFFSGIIELIASVLLLIPATQLMGAGIAMAIMAGAIFSHIFILGIIVQDDGGSLFILACIVFVSSFLVIFLQRNQAYQIVSKYFGDKR